MAWLIVSFSYTKLWSMWSFWLVFCDCGFHSVFPLVDEDKSFVQVSWWVELTWGKLCLALVPFFSSALSLSRVRLFATPWITARQVSLSITSSWSLLKLMSIESVMPSSHLILCHLLLLLPPIPPSIRVFYNESTLRMRWPKYWIFSFSISPSNEHPGPLG